jgi:hypothetical protein
MCSETSWLVPSTSHEQDGGGVGGVAGVHEVLGGLDGRAVHHLQPAGMMPAAMMSATRRRPSRRRRRPPAAPGRAPAGAAAHGDLDGDDAEHALGAGQQGQQVVAGGVQMLAAELDQLAVDGDHLDPSTLWCQPVLQAVHAAGVLGHVAADGAGDLAGRVRGVVEAIVLDRLGDGEVAHARLDAAVRLSGRCRGCG